MQIIIGIIFGILVGNYLADAATVADCASKNEAIMRLKGIAIKCSILSSVTRANPN